MKINKLTPGHNLLWESSRMILPEHVEVYNQHRKQFAKKAQPVLDEQKLEEISAIIQDSYHHHVSVTITVFDEYEERQFTGVVTQLEPDLKSLKLKDGQQYFKIDCTLITDVAKDVTPR